MRKIVRKSSAPTEEEALLQQVRRLGSVARAGKVKHLVGAYVDESGAMQPFWCSTQIVLPHALLCGLAAQLSFRVSWHLAHGYKRADPPGMKKAKRS